MVKFVKIYGFDNTSAFTKQWGRLFVFRVPCSVFRVPCSVFRISGLFYPPISYQPPSGDRAGRATLALPQKSFCLPSFCPPSLKLLGDIEIGIVQIPAVLQGHVLLRPLCDLDLEAHAVVRAVCRTRSSTVESGAWGWPVLRVSAWGLAPSGLSFVK